MEAAIPEHQHLRGYRAQEAGAFSFTGVARPEGSTQEGVRRKSKHPDVKPLEAAGANDVWCADFKGQFSTRDGQLCYPLTVTDALSRYLLGCHGLPSVEAAGAIPVFTRLFQEYGLPTAIRTDNGVPFATTAVGELSRLNVYWTKLGIQRQRIQPGQPEQNGRLNGCIGR